MVVFKKIQFQKNISKWRIVGKAIVVILLLCSAIGNVGAFITPPIKPTASTLFMIKSPSRCFKTTLNMWSNDNDDLIGSDKIKACIPYMLPLAENAPFSTYIDQRIPAIELFNDIFINPIYHLFEIFPLTSLVLFCVFTLGTYGNTNIHRTVRFNAQQAALLDILLFIPQIIGDGKDMDTLPRYIQEPCSNFVWIGTISLVTYCIISNIRGKKPNELPYISDFAELLTGPL